MREIETSDQPPPPYVVRVIPQTIPAINQNQPTSQILLPSNGTVPFAVQIGCQTNNLPLSFQPIVDNPSSSMYATILQTPDGQLFFQSIPQAPPINLPLPISCFANSSVENQLSLQSLPDNSSTNMLSDSSINGQSSLLPTISSQAAESNNSTSPIPASKNSLPRGRPRKRPAIDSRSAPTSTTINHRSDIPNTVSTVPNLPSVASPSVPSSTSTPAAVSRAGSMTNSTASLEDGSLRDSSSNASRAARPSARPPTKTSTTRSRPKTSPQPPPKQDWLARKLESLSDTSRQAILIIETEVAKLKSNRALDSRQAEL